MHYMFTKFMSYTNELVDQSETKLQLQKVIITKFQTLGFMMEEKLDRHELYEEQCERS